MLHFLDILTMNIFQREEIYTFLKKLIFLSKIAYIQQNYFFFFVFPTHLLNKEYSHSNKASYTAELYCKDFSRDMRSCRRRRRFLFNSVENVCKFLTLEECGTEFFLRKEMY